MFRLRKGWGEGEPRGWIGTGLGNPQPLSQIEAATLNHIARSNMGFGFFLQGLLLKSFSNVHVDTGAAKGEMMASPTRKV